MHIMATESTVDSILREHGYTSSDLHRRIASLAAELEVAKKERDEARDEAAHAGSDLDSSLNSLIRFTEDRLGMKLVGPCDQRDVFRLIEARVLGTEEAIRTYRWKLDFARAAEKKIEEQAAIIRRIVEKVRNHFGPSVFLADVERIAGTEETKP